MTAAAGTFIDVNKLKREHNSNNPIEVYCYRNSTYELAPAPLVQAKLYKIFFTGQRASFVIYRVRPSFLRDKANFKPMAAY